MLIMGNNYGNDRLPLIMTFFRTRLSVAVAWAMMPLAIWAGMPSTACVCANGRLKLFCQYVLGAKLPALAATGCTADCCNGVAADHDADCCGGSFCGHGGTSATTAIGAKSCCNPIVGAPIVAPRTVHVPCDQAPAIVAVVQEIGPLVHPSFFQDVAEFDTGPPLDRVIVFRSLLI
jgi:hypothetical protein